MMGVLVSGGGVSGGGVSGGGVQVTLQVLTIEHKYGGRGGDCLLWLQVK